MINNEQKNNKFNFQDVEVNYEEEEDLELTEE